MHNSLIGYAYGSQNKIQIDMVLVHSNDGNQRTVECELGYWKSAILEC